jgi:toxin ParE1/3/4
VAGEVSEPFATRWIDDVRGTFERLRYFPRAGMARGMLGAGLRVIFHPPYAVYYVATPGEVAIVRVLHSARDVAAIAARDGFG